MTVALVLAAMLGAALLVWRAGRGRLGRGDAVAAQGEDAGAGFVFHPAPVPDDRPPRARSLLLIALAVALVAAFGAGVLWSIGYLVNQQIARLLTR